MREKLQKPRTLSVQPETAQKEKITGGSFRARPSGPSFATIPTHAPIQLKGGAAEEGAQVVPSAGAPLPAPLRQSIESMSGIDMSDVRVHYNSDMPAALNAH